MYKVATVRDLFTKSASDFSPGSWLGISKRTFVDDPLPELLTPKEKLIQQRLAKLYPAVPGPVIGMAGGPEAAIRRLTVKYPSLNKPIFTTMGGLGGMVGGAALGDAISGGDLFDSGFLAAGGTAAGAPLGYALGQRLENMNADTADIERATYALGESKRLARLQDADPVAFAKAMRANKIKTIAGGAALGLSAAVNTALPIYALAKLFGG